MIYIIFCKQFKNIITKNLPKKVKYDITQQLHTLNNSPNAIYDPNQIQTYEYIQHLTKPYLEPFEAVISTNTNTET